MLEIYSKLADLTLEWNEKINVTAIKDKEEFINKNVIDSLSFAGRPEIESAKRILDVGTGGGYPGLPLAINYPDKEFVLTDAVGKKLTVVKDVASKLGVSNVTAVHGRVEDLAKDKKYRECFDLVVSRAVANMSTLSEYCLPFVKVGGFFAAYKTETAADEVAAAKRAIELLGGELSEIVSSNQQDSGHNFVIIRKIKSTPSVYPRKAGTPSKDPL